jgi:hypothetical protein
LNLIKLRLFSFLSLEKSHNYAVSKPKVIFKFRPETLKNQIARGKNANI